MQKINYFKNCENLNLLINKMHEATNDISKMEEALKLYEKLSKDELSVFVNYHYIDLFDLRMYDYEQWKLKQ